MARSLKRIASAATALGFVAILAGCSGISVNTDYDPLQVGTISSFQTYGWLPHPGGGDERVNNELLEGRVMRAVDDVFAARGYEKVSSDPDFLVGWHASVEGQSDVTTMNNYYGYGWGRWRAGGGVWVQDTHVREYDEGTLILDVVDADSNELVWRGAAQGEVNLEASPEEREERVRNAVQKILESFPPGAGG